MFHSLMPVKESLHQKHKIPIEDLDLSKEFVPINGEMSDRLRLLNLLFEVLTTEEIDAIRPEGLHVSCDMRGSFVAPVRD